MSLSAPSFLSRNAAVALVSAALVAGCGDDGPGGATTLTGYEGVVAAFDGSETGTVNLNLSNSGSGSTGSFTLNGILTVFSSVVFDGNTVNASGGGFTFTGTAANATIDGSYTAPVGSGIFSALEEVVGVTPVLYCGEHLGVDGAGGDIGGPLNIVLIGEALRGVFATVEIPALQGVVTGTVGDDNAEVEGIPGSVTVLVDAQTMSGVYSFEGGESGGFQGGLCPSAPPEIISKLIGVFGVTAGGNGGGRINFSLSSTDDNTGGFNLDGVDQIFDAFSRDGDRIDASGGGFSFSGTVANNTLDGTFTGPGGETGSFSTLLDPEDGSLITSYCGDHSGSVAGGGTVAGEVRFVTVGNILRGVFATLTGTGPSGIVSGTPGDNNATLAGEPGDMTFLINSQGFSGIYGFDDGTSGGFQGPFCP